MSSHSFRMTNGNLIPSSEFRVNPCMSVVTYSYLIYLKITKLFRYYLRILLQRKGYKVHATTFHDRIATYVCL